MVTSDDCLKKYGTPSPKNPWLVLWRVPEELQIGLIPSRIFCNRDLVYPLTEAFTNLVSRCSPDEITCYVDELKSWDGCFNVRMKRGGNTWSLHSWGIAVDVNAAENPLGAEPKLSPGFVRCFIDAGFDWGGDWKHPKDGMHFQLKEL